MSALVAAAKKEGKLNMITLPDNWANYGAIMKEFTAKYGIKINDAIPDGSSAQEIQAIQSPTRAAATPRTSSTSARASRLAADQKLFAPYKVATWSDDPRRRQGRRTATGTTTTADTSPSAATRRSSRPARPPGRSCSARRRTSAVALNGVPGQAGAATGAVWAAALNNGGSFTNAAAGPDVLQHAEEEGNLNSTDCDSRSPDRSRPVPDHDQLGLPEHRRRVGSQGLTAKWKVVVPTGTPFAEFYAQAISATAPDPAAARLWEEFLYSTTGQNLFLKGYARPVEQAAMVKNKTIDEAALKALPPVTGNVGLPDGR